MIRGWNSHIKCSAISYHNFRSFTKAGFVNPRAKRKRLATPAFFQSHDHSSRATIVHHIYSTTLSIRIPVHVPSSSVSTSSYKMFRFSVLSRCSRRDSSSMVMGIARSKRFSEPNDFILGIKHRMRSTWASRSSPPQPAPKFSVLFTQKRNLHNYPKSTTERTGLRKGRIAKSISTSTEKKTLFGPQNPPPGYVFVSRNDAFMYRRCRQVAPKKVFLVFSHRGRRRSARLIGLYVQIDIFVKVKPEYEHSRNRRDILKQRAKKRSKRRAMMGKKRRAMKRKTRRAMKRNKKG